MKISTVKSDEEAVDCIVKELLEELIEEICAENENGTELIEESDDINNISNLKTENEIFICGSFSSEILIQKRSFNFEQVQMAWKCLELLQIEATNDFTAALLTCTASTYDENLQKLWESHGISMKGENFWKNFNQETTQGSRPPGPFELLIRIALFYLRSFSESSIFLKEEIRVKLAATRFLTALIIQLEKLAEAGGIALSVYLNDVFGQIQLQQTIISLLLTLVFQSEEGSVLPNAIALRFKF